MNVNEIDIGFRRGLIYAVAGGGAKIPMLIFAAAGFTISLFVTILLVRFWHELQNLAKEAKDA